MDRTLGPILIDVFAHRLHFISNKCWLRGLVKASVNLHGRISKRARQPMQAIKSRLMQLHNWTGPQFKWPFRVLHMRADDIECQGKLPEAVFSLSTCNLDRIAQ